MQNKSFIEKGRSLGEFFIKGESVIRVWDMVGSGFMLINSFFIIRALSLYQFGSYQLVLVFIGLVDSFNLDLFDGVVSVEMRHHSNDSRLDIVKRILEEYAIVKIAVAVIMTLGVFFGASWAASHYGSDIGLFVKIMSPFFVISTLQSLEKQILKNSFSLIYYSGGCIREIVKFFFLIIAFFYGHLGIAVILIIHMLGLLGSLVFTSVFFWRIYKNYFLGLDSAKGFFLKSLIKAHGKWVSIRYIVAKFSSNVTPWFIKFFINTEGVAIYSLAYNLIAFIQEFFPVNGLPWIFLMKIDNKDEMGYIFRRFVKYLFWFGTLVGLLALAFVPPIVNLIFPKYHDTWPLFRLMLLVFPVFGVYKIIKEVLTILREYKILTLRLPIEAAANIASLVIFLSLFGLIGAALAYIALYLARIIFFYPALKRLHPNFRIKIKDLFRFDKDDAFFLKKFWKQLNFILSDYLSKLKLLRKSG